MLKAKLNTIQSDLVFTISENSTNIDVFSDMYIFDWRPCLKSSNHRSSLVVREGSRGFYLRPRQNKVFKSGSRGFPPLALRITAIALRLVGQCQDNGPVKYWSKLVQETWICELSSLNN